MFTACPHCQFLVAHDPRSGVSPPDCPRCGKALVMKDGATTPAPSFVTLLHAVPDPASPASGADASDAAAADSESGTSPAPSHASAADAPAQDVSAATTPAESEGNHDAVTSDDSISPDPHVHGDPSAPAGVPANMLDVPIAAPSARRATGPRFLQRVRTTPVHAKRARAQWTVVAALALLLCMQVIVADRARLAMQAGWRPIVVALCGIARCDVPTWREPAAFTMLSRDVRPLLDAPGTLLAQATFRNEARWAQAWPIILLTLKDADGRTLGARALRPEDYLPEGEAVTAIGPGQSAQVAVRIREPSASVVAFSFDFR